MLGILDNQTFNVMLLINFIKAIHFNTQSDILGSAASTLCLIHCLATPFLFVAHAEHIHDQHHVQPLWWGTLDILLIGVSLLAVYWSAKNTSKTWMCYALWVSWGALAFVILNEKVGIIHLIEEVIYVPSIALVILHLYNRKYCQCGDETCCATS